MESEITPSLILRIILLALSPLLSTGLLAQPVLDPASNATITAGTQKLSLAPYSYYYEDAGGSLSIEDVRQPEYSRRFIANLSRDLHFGLTRSAYWIRFSLDWDMDSAHSVAPDWLLEVGPPKHVEGLSRGGTDLYVLNEQGVIVHSDRLGDYDSPEELRTLQVGFAVSIDPATAREIYLRVESTRDLRLPLTMWSEESFRRHEINANTGFGIKYGILLAMICYNLFLFVSIRERSYLFYVLAMSAQLGLIFFDSKHARFLDLGSIFGPWFIDISERIAYILVALTYLQFQRHFLRLWRYDYRLDRIFLLLIAAFGCLLLLALIPDEKIMQAFLVPLVTLGIAAGFYANIDAILRGFEVAVVHLVASSIFLVGAAVQISYQIWGIFPANWFTLQSLQLGLIAQSLLLSFGLAYKYNIIKKEKEEAQREAIQNLTRSEEIKDQLLANVSHELRTPLFGITGLVEVALRELERDGTEKSGHPLDDETTRANYSLVRRNVSLIRASSLRLMRLIDELLDFSALRQNVTRLRLTSVDLHEQAALVLAICRPLSGEKHLELINGVARGLPPVAADEDRLQQTLINLVSNAIKFTEAGQVSIKASLEKDAFRAEETAVQEGNGSDSESGADAGRIVIRVTDTGPGIDSREHDLIFNSFEKGASAIGGVGLGLAIARRLVEFHGSELTVESVPGQGASFTFSLPVSQQAPAGKQGAATSSQKLIRRSDYGSRQHSTVGELPAAPENEQPADLNDATSTILIVDDDATNLQLMSQQLSQYHVRLADSGVEALSAVYRHKPDLVLLDLMMPNMDGYQVCDELRQHYDATELPIILVTARNHLEDLIQGFGRNANDYLTKPFYIEELHARVANQLKLSHLQQINADNARLRTEIEHYVEAERELTTSRLRFQRVLEGIQAGLIAFTPPGEVVYMNQRAADLLGLPTERLLSQNLRSLLPGNNRNNQLLQTLLAWESGEHLPAADETFEIEMVLPEEGEYRASSALRFQARLSLLHDEDHTGVLFLEMPQEEVESARQDETLDAIRLLSKTQRSVRKLRGRLKVLTPKEIEDSAALLRRLNEIDHLAEHINDLLPTAAPQEAYREQLVALMRCALHAWEISTQQSKIELAEESRIWAVSVDDGRLRTRTFDRYLRIDLLPRVPRWREVIRTAYFVLSRPDLTPESRETLKRELEKTRELLQQAAIS